MKAVNQSIGRSVRHQRDYAAVLLLDHRYQRDNVCNALPKWLQPSLQVHSKFGSAFAQLNKVFFCYTFKNKIDNFYIEIQVASRNNIL
jgi:Rad3-related DNA helicase